MSKPFCQLLWVILLILVLSHAATRNVITSLPGYAGDLPFYLETGYVGVGENEEVQLFYYFVKSEGDPKKDPLLLWLTGGPGCSAFSGLVIEIGPLKLNISSSSWQSEALVFQLNPYSWTKVSSIVFLDAPVGTGFSYATAPGAYSSNDILQSSRIYEFLRKWVVEHIEYKDNPLFISGDSYCGKIVPIVVNNVIKGDLAGNAPKINLKGYILGNPYTRLEDETISEIEYAERVSLLSKELLEETLISCNSTHYVDADDEDCENNLLSIYNNLDPLFDAHVLEPKCLTPQTECQETSYQLLFPWANNMQVQEALKIRQGTKSQWTRCNDSLAYVHNVESTVAYHQSLTTKSINALVYSGDQDMKISYLGTLEWIKDLNITITEDWRPWTVNGQVAGYTTKFSNGHYNLTFATVKGAGHTAPEYKRQECLSMIAKWLAEDPL